MTAATTSPPSPPTDEPAPRSFRAWLITKVEPSLQHNGFTYTFLFAYFLLNALIALRGGAIGYVLGKNDKYVIFDVLARIGGALLNLNSALVFLVAAKTTITYLRGTPLNMFVPFDKSMPAFHSLIGNVIVGATVLHVGFQTANYIAFDLVSNNPPDRVGLTTFPALLITGVLLIAILFAMRVTALPYFRRKNWELFWGTHYGGFVIFFVILMLHGFHNKVPMTWRYTTGPVAIYVVDRFLRYYREQGLRHLVDHGNLKRHGDDMVSVRLPRTADFSYKAGQYAELKIPYISTFQWHPFTIASSPHESEILFYIKNNGDWTGKLFDLATADDAPNDIWVHVRGPYGAPAQHVDQYNHVVLISGGVGATPFASITKYAHNFITNHTTRVSNNSVFAAFNRNQSAHTSTVPNTPSSRSANISRSGSRRISVSQRPPSYTREFSRSSSGAIMARVDTDDSVSRVIQHQRRNQPYGPLERSFPDRPKVEDYVLELGDPDAPIPDRFGDSDLAQDVRGMEPAVSARSMMEVVREYDSSRSLFSHEDEDPDDPDEEYNIVGRTPYSDSSHSAFDDNLEFGAIDGEESALQLEYEILREQQTASNAYNNLGVSYGADALLRHLQAAKTTQWRLSQMRESMNAMDERFDKAPLTDRILFYLHTVTLNWVLLWIMIIRFSLVAVGGIVGYHIIEKGRLHLYNSEAFAVADLILAVLVLIPVLATTAIEIIASGLGAYLAEDVGNIADLCLLIPLLSSSMILTAFVGFKPRDGDMVFLITVLALWPITMLLLLWRTARTIGSRIFLARHLKSSVAKTKSLDFIWVSKKHTDDQWLIKELLPLASDRVVRLHRFITREEPTTEPWMLDYEKVPLKTAYKRPDWDDVFSSLVERSRSGTNVGVFFCGPDGMARAVRQSAMRAMAVSVQNALERGYVPKLASADDKEDEEEPRIQTSQSSQTPFGVSLHTPRNAPNTPGVFSRVMSKGAHMVRNASSRRAVQRTDSAPVDRSQFGCNVRISVRIENFN